MKTSHFALFGLFLSAILLSPAQDTHPARPGAAGRKIVPLSQERLDRLLAKRLTGATGYTFSQFANMFVVRSNMDLGSGVGLMTASSDIAETELSPSFPESYRPTLRELLDIIALQTHSGWSYDPTDRFIHNTTDKAVNDFAVFEFKQRERAKPFAVTLASGWTAVDQGSWTMHRPPSFPVGLDIYEMGSYSSDNPEEESALLKKIPVEVSLEWARRVKPAAGENEFKSVRVGDYGAIYFEDMIPSQRGTPVRWRQWVFMAGRTCYFIVSTIFPEQEKEIYPDVEQMLRSFRIRSPGKDAPKPPPS